jgi:hypothetical protein
VSNWIRAPRAIAPLGLLSSLFWWSKVGGGILVLALMLAPAVVVPLGIALAARRTSREPPTLFYRGAVCLLPLDMLASGIGWTALPGHRDAILCAAVHVVVCVLIAAYGAARAFSRVRGAGFAGLFTPLPEMAIDVGLMLLPVGSVWLLASRAASSLLGFHEPIVTLTAAHFHYAGFAAPLVIGCAGRLFALADATEAKVALAYRIGTITVCAGIPLTAIGIMTTHTVEATAAVTLACGMLIACLLLVVVVPRRAAERSKAAAALFGIAGIALLGTMALAATFAVTSSAGRGSAFDGPLSVQTMIDYHGGGNALGFALCALLALTLCD